MSACRERAGSARDQCGFALIALLALAALFAAFLIASTLDFTATGNARDREDRSMDALRKAKAALIAYAANEQWQLYKALPKTPATDASVYFQPGALPCPDQNNDGDADCFGSTLASMIGRLPFTTLGIDDLRDASGERLWYALSHDFRKAQCAVPPIPPALPAAGCTTINSDTQGQLAVIGMAPATQVVAIVFAPGAPLDLRAVGGPLQDRTAGPNSPANYLENFDPGDNVHFTFTATGSPTGTANDRLLVITQAELMAAVEPVVAARIERDIGKGLLQDYFVKWGRYPFAMPFASPSFDQSVYIGASSPGPGTTMGLLPITNTAPFTWASATVTSLGTGTGRYEDPTKTITPNPKVCSISAPPPPQTVTCTFSYNGSNGDDRPDIKIEVILTNAALAFAGPSVPAAPDLTILRAGTLDFPQDNGSTFGYWSTGSDSGVPQFIPTTTFVLQGTGALLTYAGRLQNAPDMNNGAQITFQLPSGYLPRFLNPAGTTPNIAWFISNQWYRQTYYAMALGYAPGFFASGTPAACNPPPAAAPLCLTVNNLPGTTNNKQAILIFAGRALENQSRPSGTLSNYFEGQNATPADLIFEQHRTGVPMINDRVVVVSP